MLSDYTVTQRPEIQGEEQKQGMTWPDLSQFLVTDVFIALPRNTEVDLSAVREHLGFVQPLACPKKVKVRSMPSCSDLQSGQRGVGDRAEGIPRILSDGKQVVVEVYQGHVVVPGLGRD